MQTIMHRDTVFIVEDDPSVRDALSLLLSLSGYATAMFASAEDFLAALGPDWRGCLVVDIRMNGMTGLELQQHLLERRPRLPVVVITAHGDVATARQAFLHDAVDFIEKPFDGEQLLAAVRKAMQRLGPTPATGPGPTRIDTGEHSLTTREREVMALLVRGLHNRRIAEELRISPRTVEIHKARVLQKMGASNLIELVRSVASRER